MSGITSVVPVYNRGDLVGETLTAMFSQTLPPDEIIVVDDGSQAETLAILAGFGNRIRLIRQEHEGDFVARNKGLRAASTRLVAFYDSDDLWSPHFLAEMSKQWQDESELIACYSDFQILCKGIVSERSKFDDAPSGYWSGLRAQHGTGEVFDTSIVARVMNYQPFFPSCLIVSRDKFLDAGGWDEEVTGLPGGDFATVLRIANQPPVGVVRHPLVTIRKHDRNFSSNTEQMNLGDALVLEHVLRRRPELAPFADIIRRSVVRRRCNALESAFSRRDFSQTRKIFQLYR